MVTPDLLHHYPIFSFLKPEDLLSTAAVSYEEFYPAGSIIYHETEHTDWLYILVDGSVELLFIVLADNPEPIELKFGQVNSGEMFGISALLEPYLHTSTARAVKPSQVIRVKASALIELCNQDVQVAYNIMQQVAMTTLRRLNATRSQLATTYSEQALGKSKMEVMP